MPHKRNPAADGQNLTGLSRMVRCLRHARSENVVLFAALQRDISHLVGGAHDGPDATVTLDLRAQPACLGGRSCWSIDQHAEEPESPRRPCSFRSGVLIALTKVLRLASETPTSCPQRHSRCGVAKGILAAAEEGRRREEISHRMPNRRALRPRLSLQARRHDLRSACLGKRPDLMGVVTTVSFSRATPSASSNCLSIRLLKGSWRRRRMRIWAKRSATARASLRRDPTQPSPAAGLHPDAHELFGRT